MIVSDDGLALDFYLLKVAFVLNHGKLVLLFLKNIDSVWLWQCRKGKAGIVIHKGMWFFGDTVSKRNLNLAVRFVYTVPRRDKETRDN